MHVGDSTLHPLQIQKKDETELIFAQKDYPALSLTCCNSGQMQEVPSITDLPSRSYALDLWQLVRRLNRLLIFGMLGAFGPRLEVQ